VADVTAAVIRKGVLRGFDAGDRPVVW